MRKMFIDPPSGWQYGFPAILEEGKDYKDVPAGKYTCVVERVEFKETKLNKKPYMNFGLQICDGSEHEGQFIFKKAFLANIDNVSFLKKDLLVLCPDVDLSKSLAALDLTKFLNKIVEVTVKYSTPKGDKDPFQNVYFNKLAEGKAEEPEETHVF